MPDFLNDRPAIVRFNPPSSEGGVVSSITWQQRDCQRALRIMFGCGEREHIRQVDITVEGIRAYIEYTPPAAEVAGG